MPPSSSPLSVSLLYSGIHVGVGVGVVVGGGGGGGGGGVILAAWVLLSTSKKVMTHLSAFNA